MWEELFKAKEWLKVLKIPDRCRHSASLGSAADFGRGECRMRVTSPEQSLWNSHAKHFPFMVGAGFLRCYKESVIVIMSQSAQAGLRARLQCQGPTDNICPSRTSGAVHFEFDPKTCKQLNESNSPQRLVISNKGGHHPTSAHLRGHHFPICQH